MGHAHMMQDRYLPPSDFLRSVIEEVAPLTGGAFAELNLLRLIFSTADADRANRDWATLLLAQLKLNRPDVRAALERAAEDDDMAVRAEAILGLALIDRTLALPHLQRELSGPSVPFPLFEAAQIVAHSSLVADLEMFAEPSGDAYVDKAALAALDACRTAQPER